ncbi:unnamed protein product [Albugo candida]|uniref:Uncharacterized protein n=1 Tax=Albugo candida TaxID=65357 RepID=A0A024FWN7_9STRA|nr:unnamed protein product [Albugo candida]|eukprot:CCI11588.1 unnamed protein product [Albugo candida]
MGTQYDSAFLLSPQSSAVEYFCHPSFLKVTSKGKSPYQLRPNGIGKDCNTFRYEFYKNQIEFARSHEFSFVPTLVMKSHTTSWNVQIKELSANGKVRYGPRSFFFHMGARTEFHIPEFQSLEQGSNVFRLTTNEGKQTLIISVPPSKIAQSDSDSWYLVIGNDLLENLRIGFRKVGEEQFEVGLGKMSIEASSSTSTHDVPGREFHIDIKE